MSLNRLYRHNQVSRLFIFWTSAQEFTFQFTGAWSFSTPQRTEAPSNAAFSIYTHCWVLPVQSSARGPRTQGQCINLGTPGECHMQSRNEIVHTVLQFKSRTISFLFLRVGFYIYCSIILGLRATPHHGTLSHNTQPFWLLKPHSISREKSGVTDWLKPCLQVIMDNILVR